MMQKGSTNLRPSRRGQEPAPQDEGLAAGSVVLHPDEARSPLILHPEEARSAVSKGEGPNALSAPRLAFRNGAFAQGVRVVAEETALAMSFNGSTHAVMMATPCDLHDFAVGFALTERIVTSPQDIEEIAFVETPFGIDVQMRLPDDAAGRMGARRRAMAGPTGCGLCGVESLEVASRAIAPVNASAMLHSSDVVRAVAMLHDRQPLNAQTRAVHAAGFLVPGEGMVAVREDVGRHNALDKLIGALARMGVPPETGAIVLTSRVSVEMVQKTAISGCGVIIAVSAPTALAICVAESAGITLIAVARGDEFEMFTHPHRIGTGVDANAA
jgi:FdhD protein